MAAQNGLTPVMGGVRQTRTTLQVPPQVIHLRVRVIRLVEVTQGVVERAGVGEMGGHIPIVVLCVSCYKSTRSAPGRMAELVYATDLKSVASRHVGSIPTSATNKIPPVREVFCYGTATLGVLCLHVFDESLA